MGPEAPEQEIFLFDGYQLDAATRTLTDPEGRPVKLLPKAFDILTYLIGNNRRVVTKDELLASLWPDTVVEENNLTQNISSLRRALGEKPQDNRFIATIPGRGYRFVANVRPPASAAAASGEPDSASRSGSRSPSLTGSRWLGLATLGVALAGILAAGFYFYRETGSIPQGATTLAVLPFKPISNENRDEALEVGMTEALIRRLGGAEGLRVAPLGAVRRFGLLEQDPLQAGRQLGVESVLDGAVLMGADRVRVTAKLLRVSDGQQLWTGQFDEPLRDIFAVQDSISQRVAAALAARMAGRRRGGETDNVEAYQYFVRGKYHAYKLILPELQKGIEFYEKAIAADPGYAIAHVELANAYRAMVLTNDAPPAELMPRSRAMAQKAVALDENLAEAWTAVAFTEFWYDWDWEASENHFKRALEIDPNSAQSHAFYAHLLSNTGRHDEAMREIRRAREIDPIHPVYAAMEGQILSLAGRIDESTLILKAAADLDPNFWLAQLFLSRNYILKQQWNEALAAAQRAREITGGNAEAVATAGYIFGRTGREEEAREMLAELESPRDRFVSAYTVAQIYLGLGDRAKALDHLEKAFEQKEALIVFLKVEPKWDALRSEPRFVDLLDRLKLK
jgi:DNA-binding winged helix-turn-helix (wHTH) protein/TolB-like protein/Tfp pilus assembly protein PilF